MRITDLSQPIRTGMQVYPGDPEVTVTTVATVAQDGYQVASLHAGSHTGTHLDAPLHSILGGESVDGIDLGRLVGPARIVQCGSPAPHEVIRWASVAGQLQDLDGIAMVLFNMLGGLATFQLRRTHANVPRPYRTWGYPWVPLTFVASSMLILLNTLLERPVESLLGLALVALGLPMFWCVSRSTSRSRPAGRR